MKTFKTLIFLQTKIIFPPTFSSCLYKKVKIYNLLIEIDNPNILKKLFNNHALMEKKDLHGNKIRFITNSLKEAILGGTIVKILKTFKKGIISSSFYDSTIFASVLIKK